MDKSIKTNKTPEQTDEKEYDLITDLLEWAEAFVLAMFVVIIVFIFFLRIVEVAGPSMSSTLSDKDRIILTHLNYTPERGDIVVCNSKTLNKCIIKRCIGVGGDTVCVNYNDDTVKVNGEYIDQSYINEADMREQSIFDQRYRTSDGVYNYTVPEGTIFVMGDNRNHSTDSRSDMVGFVSLGDVLGKAIFRFYPFSSIGSI
ncbi:MAG: signal peptidase I [Ruminococcus sp.]|nr:signal peptidase I [Ruminococcus sp.]